MTADPQDFQSRNPASGELVWEGVAATESDVALTVGNARSALLNIDLGQRKRAVESFAIELESRRDAFVDAISQETGKPRWESQTEVSAMLGKIRFSIEAQAERQAPQVSEASATRYKPHGVAAVLGPFNLPGHLPNAHIVPALLAGNTIVFKPSEQTPLVGRLLTETWQACGLDDAIHLVQGELATGKALVAHPDIDAIFFTGSFAGGLAISKSRIDNPGVIVALEMGGNNPLVVWDPCDIDAAVYNIVLSAFITAGQRCVCARRLILPEGEFGDSVLARLVEVASNLRIGPPSLDPEPFYGPVISAHAASQVLLARDELLELGAETLLEMTRESEDSSLLSPGILDVTAISDLPDQEIFGPLLQVIRVPDFESAITEANQTAYGLSSGLLCEDRELWEAYFQHAQAGIVNWNRPITGASGAQPFGGIGQSGNHRPSGYFAIDYCAFPVASTFGPSLEIPDSLAPGIQL